MKRSIIPNMRKKNVIGLPNMPDSVAADSESELGGGGGGADAPSLALRDFGSGLDACDSPPLFCGSDWLGFLLQKSRTALGKGAGPVSEAFGKNLAKAPTSSPGWRVDFCQRMYICCSRNPHCVWQVGQPRRLYSPAAAFNSLLGMRLSK